jgi:hypothetical protein
MFYTLERKEPEFCVNSQDQTFPQTFPPRTPEAINSFQVQSFIEHGYWVLLQRPPRCPKAECLHSSRRFVRTFDLRHDSKSKSEQDLRFLRFRQFCHSRQSIRVPYSDYRSRRNVDSTQFDRNSSPSGFGLGQQSRCQRRQWRP